MSCPDKVEFFVVLHHHYQSPLQWGSRISIEALAELASLVAPDRELHFTFLDDEYRVRGGISGFEILLVGKAWWFPAPVWFFGIDLAACAQRLELVLRHVYEAKLRDEEQRVFCSRFVVDRAEQCRWVLETQAFRDTGPDAVKTRVMKRMFGHVAREPELEVHLVKAKDLTEPFPVGRIQCNECGGTGEKVLFQVPQPCQPCEGTGWMGGKAAVKGASPETSGETPTQATTTETPTEG